MAYLALHFEHETPNDFLLFFAFMHRRRVEKTKTEKRPFLFLGVDTLNSNSRQVFAVRQNQSGNPPVARRLAEGFRFDAESAN